MILLVIAENFAPLLKASLKSISKGVFPASTKPSFNFSTAAWASFCACSEVFPPFANASSKLFAPLRFFSRPARTSVDEPISKFLFCISNAFL